MAELPPSQLPQDPKYWEQLAQRIRQDASGLLASYAAAQDAWYDLLARRAGWLMAASAAAMLLLSLALPGPDHSHLLGWMERSLTPTESAARLLGGSQPPRVEELLAQFPPPAEERRQR
jgi:hypothetical protein